MRARTIPTACRPWLGSDAAARLKPASKPRPLRGCYTVEEMPPIINAQQISKTYGVAPLFRDISFTVSEGDRIGLIGPNGAGKSTLLQILAGRITPDAGEVALRRRTRLSYVSQHSEF